MSVEVSKNWEAEVRMFTIFAHRRAASTNSVTLRTAAYDPYPEMKMKIGKIDHNLNLDLGPSDVRVCVLMLCSIPAVWTRSSGTSSQQRNMPEPTVVEIVVETAVSKFLTKIANYFIAQWLR